MAACTPGAGFTNPCFAPADNATGVPVNSNIVATFDSAWNNYATAKSVYIYYSNGTLWRQVKVDGAEVSGSGTVNFTIDPSINLPYNQSMYINFQRIFRESGSASYYILADNTTWNFTTETDIVAPLINTLSPADNATGVSATANLIMTFSENVVVVSGDVRIRRISDNVTVETIDISSGQVTGTGTSSITINPAITLASSTAYYIEVDATAIDDTAGNSFAGISGNSTWNFTVADTVAPLVTSFSPVHLATAVNNGSNLVITFDENIDVQTGNIRIRRTADASTFATIDVTTGLVTGNGTSSITINPASNLEALTSYYVEIDGTAFDDNAGNSFLGFSGSATWSFTTYGIPKGWYSANWARRLILTVNASQVSSTLTDFPVYVDLSTLPASFFANIQSDGADIRVTQGDGLTAVAVEIVKVNTAGSTGELYFKAGNLSSTVNTNFYIYYDNPNARMLNGADTLGFQNVWTNSYVAVYHLQEPTANTNAKIRDSSSYQNHGNTNGSMTTANQQMGIAGTALNFDGVDDYLSIPSNNSFYLVTGPGIARSVSYWLKTTETGLKVIMEKGYKLNLSERISAGLARGGTKNNYAAHANSITSVNDNAWHFVTHTYSGASNKIYVDSGAAENTVAETAALGNVTDVTIGANYLGTENYAGLLDEIRISSVARTQAWIEAEYVNIKTPNTFYSISAEELVTATSNPKIVSVYPANNSVQYPIKHSLKMIFDEVVNTAAGFITIRRSSDDAVFEALNVTNAARVSGSGTNTLTLIPSSSLVQGTTYYVLVDVSALEDTSTNPYPGITNKKTWSFTTQGSNSIKKNQIFILDGN